uniref:Uncharacterized protein n=1 Tax=mine drainage metagenome TaxID=410659 RepID=E6QN87_9ZZZZ
MGAPSVSRQAPIIEVVSGAVFSLRSVDRHEDSRCGYSFHSVVALLLPKRSGFQKN